MKQVLIALCIIAVLLGIGWTGHSIFQRAWQERQLALEVRRVEEAKSKKVASQEEDALLLMSLLIQAGAQQKAQQQAQSYATCPRCGGSGWIYYQNGGSEYCRQCGGTGNARAKTYNSNFGH